MFTRCHSLVQNTSQNWWRLRRPVEGAGGVGPAVQEGAALRLQSRWRGYAARQRFKLWREAALVLQRAWRSALRRRGSAALVIQAAWRRHRARDAYLRLCAAVVRLQALSRGRFFRQT